MSEQVSKMLDDGKPKPEPRAAIVRRTADSLILVEYIIQPVFGNAHTGIPNLDFKAFAAPAASDQHLSRLGVSDRVRNEVVQDPLEQNGVGAHERAVRHDNKFDVFRIHIGPRRTYKMIEQIIDRDVTLKRMWFGNAEGGNPEAVHNTVWPVTAALPVIEWAYRVRPGAVIDVVDPLLRSPQ